MLSQVSGPRSLQASQWGMLCPSDTPEGESCGLVKNLALMAHVTTDAKEGPLLCAAYNLGVEDLHMVGGEEINSEQCYVIFLNGIMIGVHKQPHKFATSFRTLRRRGIVGESVLGSWVFY